MKTTFHKPNRKRANLSFGFSVLAADPHSHARAGILRTPHGEVATPAFMPVGTAGSVKALSPEDLRSAGAQIILGNTYHLHLRPGEGAVRKLGGLHSFTAWQGPILTDSGGYQVGSLGHFIDPDSRSFASLRGKRDGFKPSQIDEDGVTFFSHLDGSRHRFTPEISMDIQYKLGADIIMAFDEATPARGKRYAREAMERTHNWLSRSISRWERNEALRKRGEPRQALFGIIQGGNYRDLRRASAEFIVGKGLPGVAMGGASIGKDPRQTQENIGWVADLIPSDSPLYLMGVGVNPRDLVAAVQSGADLFDCVAPTRLARMGHLYFGSLRVSGKRATFESPFTHGRLSISNAQFRLDQKPIQEGCDCYTCSYGFTRAYLNHLFRCRELLYYRLASIHNVRTMVRLTQNLREALLR